MLSALVTIAPYALNSDGLVAWALKNIVPIIMCVTGVVLLAGARKGNWSGTFSTVGIAIVALMFIVGAPLMVVFSDELAHIAFRG